MTIYISLFVFDSILILASERIKNKLLKTLLVIAAIIMPAVIAGLRAINVGTDVRGYGRRFYFLAYNSKSLRDLFNSLSLNGELTDLGFHILNYLLSRIFNNYHIGLFIYSLITSFFLYAGFKRLKNFFGRDFKMWVCWDLTLIALYNISLNAMRQLIAVSILFYATTFLLEKRIRPYLLLSLIAFMFHASAITSIVILVLFFILHDGRIVTVKKQLFQTTIFLLIVALIVIFGRNLLQILVSRGIVRTNYLNYLYGGRYATGGSLSPWNILVPSILVFVDVLLYRRSLKRISNSLFFLIMVIITLIASCGTVASSYINRVGYYFIPMQIVYQVLLTRCFDKRSKQIWLTFLLVIFSVSWIHDIGVMNYNETIPYQVNISE